MRRSLASRCKSSSDGNRVPCRFSNPHGRNISRRCNHSSKRADRLLRLVCSFAMYYCCAFRCFAAASTSSSFCSVEQGSFWIDFSACSDWNFASSCPSSCCACFDLGKIRNTSTAALPSGAFSASLYVRFPMHMQSMKTANLCTQVKNTRGEELPGLSFTRGWI